MSKLSLSSIIERDAQAIRVRFTAEDEASIRSIPIELVLDLDQFGEVIGIEILSLKSLGGRKALPAKRPPAGSAQVEFSYDGEADAAYLRFKDDRSLDQRAVDGWLELGKDGSLVGIKAKLSQ
jgi:uncharacterized protein YuzE